jgi:hypothetical protein
VVADFSGGRISSDGGALLLRELNSQYNFIENFSECFTDYRDPVKTEHSVTELIAQRIYGLCLGYEDLNDHEQLRKDPLLSALCNRADLTGESRRQESDKGAAGAGKSTLCRLERTPANATGESRYHKIACNTEKVEAFFVRHFLKLNRKAPGRIILDVDATDNKLYGNQEGRFFHGYYRHYCYLPLYIFSEDHLLAARERRSNIDGAAGTKEELERIVKQIRTEWPKVNIIVRGDSGFARDNIMTWCEENSVDYLFGLAQNNRLRESISAELEQAQRECEATEEPVRIFKDFKYQTLDSWSKERRVIGKAEWLPQGSNPRFIVTSLSRRAVKAMQLYEQHYCARGDMENRIKEQLQLFSDRASSHTMQGNQLRMWFSALAYVIMTELRRTALKGTDLGRASMNTIRLKLLKIGAQISISVRRVYIKLSSAFPYQAVFDSAFQRLR